ncbi:hypothetical protein [Streptomyces sp. NPDC006309]|uniref:hypothetical protein n=1 Tax=Streptomyces sp. NPDC006309 TaxID=3156749 RepID=UPI0033BF4A2E
MVVLLDGTLFCTRLRTGADNRKNYSGKRKANGRLLLALTDERGNLIWISSARAGGFSEITTAPHDEHRTPPRGRPRRPGRLRPPWTTSPTTIR